MPINRRKFVKSAILLPGLSMSAAAFLSLSGNEFSKPNPFSRVRPGDAMWPSEEKWMQLKKEVRGNLIKVQSPLVACKTSPDSSACVEVFRGLKNPYYIGDNPALTQTSGWLDAWRSKPSVYAVAAKDTSDVVAAVNFARENNLRLVVKGGGHSYQGTSNSGDSLLVWTRAMNNVILHDNFIAEGCAGKQAPQPAVTIEAGAMWLHTYNEVTTKKGRYVQGGGCTSVGVAGLVQGGGFGSFSKHYGMAAAALLEAEIVTADGSVKTVNACNNPDLFWALKGGGGGTFGIVTKLTVKTRELPEEFGVVVGVIKAATNESFKNLIEKFVNLYHEKLFNHHWGEQVVFRADNTMNITMLFHGLGKEAAQSSWQSFEEWIKRSQNYTFETPLTVITIPARNFWDVNFLKQHASNFIATDNRPNADENNIFWKSNESEAGQFLWAYRSAWLPASLLEKNKQQQLADALFDASRNWTTSLHFNKGLAGAPEEEIIAAKDTAMNPDVLNAFALAIIAGEGAPAFTDIKGHEPDINEARTGAQKINKAMDELLKVAPGTGSYVSESNFFEEHWQQSFWGPNYQRLATIKKKYDPDGLFFVHHGVGSEEWSDDGFTKLG